MRLAAVCRPRNVGGHLQIDPFYEVIYGQETDQLQFVSSGLEGVRTRIVEEGNS